MGPKDSIRGKCEPSTVYSLNRRQYGLMIALQVLAVVSVNRPSNNFVSSLSGDVLQEALGFHIWIHTSQPVFLPDRCQW